MKAFPMETMDSGADSPGVKIEIDASTDSGPDGRLAPPIAIAPSPVIATAELEARAGPRICGLLFRRFVYTALSYVPGNPG
jgi:hypothetical protein